MGSDDSDLDDFQPVLERKRKKRGFGGCEKPCDDSEDYTSYGSSENEEQLPHKRRLYKRKGLIDYADVTDLEVIISTKTKTTAQLLDQAAVSDDIDKITTSGNAKPWILNDYNNNNDGANWELTAP